MSKKSRRTRKRSQSPRLSAAQLIQPVQGEDRQVSTQEASPTVKGLSDLQEEYRYVVTDLKWIAVIAVVMLVVMVALALLLV